MSISVSELQNFQIIFGNFKRELQIPTTVKVGGCPYSSFC